MDFIGIFNFIRAIIGLGLIFLGVFYLFKETKNREERQKYNRSAVILFFFGAATLLFIMFDYI